jgi:hypothetical protein
VAFALRYLAAIDAGSASPVRVQQVLAVMTSRPEALAALLFESVEVRRAALQAAFDHPPTWQQPSLHPYQQTSLQALVQRFEERSNDSGLPAFDDSTVARWSRDLIPEMERVILEHFKPARRVAQGEVFHKIVAASPDEKSASDRTRLVRYVEEFEQGPLSIHYGVALAALNDYDRRRQNEDWYFRLQQRTFAATFLLMVLCAVSLLVGTRPDIPGGLKTLAVLTAFCAGIGAGSAFMYLFVRIIAGAITLTEHTSRTRTDIQTLQQLADPASERNQI